MKESVRLDNHFSAEEKQAVAKVGVPSEHGYNV